VSICAPHNQETIGLINDIIRIVHGLGLKVITEGIEVAEQQQDMARRECDMLQDFLF
jgi:EAL domain-containing protein (putative c-di-GMP-specific phosphodiesterase class I)